MSLGTIQFLGAGLPNSVSCFRYCVGSSIRIRAVFHFRALGISAEAYFGVSLSSLLVKGVLGLGLPPPLSVRT